MAEPDFKRVLLTFRLPLWLERGRPRLREIAVGPLTPECSAPSNDESPIWIFALFQNRLARATVKHEPAARHPLVRRGDAGGSGRFSDRGSHSRPHRRLSTCYSAYATAGAAESSTDPCARISKRRLPTGLLIWRRGVSGHPGPPVCAGKDRPHTWPSRRKCAITRRSRIPIRSDSRSKSRRSLAGTSTAGRPISEGGAAVATGLNMARKLLYREMRMRAWWVAWIR